jgi:hypothetical protein
MSVWVTIRAQGSAAKLEELAADDPSLFSSISERGAAQGATYHRIFGNDTTVLVVDEWPDEETFHAFFDTSADIADIMEQAGVTTPPEITVWRKLAVNDDIG